MTFTTRIGAALVVLAATLPFTLATGASSCKSTEFWYASKSCCLPHGGPPSTPSPPKGQDCPPSSYYWNTNQGCCTPKHPVAPSNPPPQCSQGWDWYSGLSMCLPGTPTAPSPPPSKPSGSYGGGSGSGSSSGYGGNSGSSSGYGGNSGSSSGYGGNSGSSSGYGGNSGSSSGSGHGGSSGYGASSWKRHARNARSAPLCPTGFDACPISGLAASDFECVDTAVELESCGGCASLGQGQDCTAIHGAWNVGCEQGRCAVYTCTAGFKRSSDGQSCIAL